MATRNLSEKFIAKRTEALKHRNRSNREDESDTLALSQTHAVNEIHKGAVQNALPPKWVDHVEEAERKIEMIDKKMATLTGMYKKRTMVTFDDINEERQEHEIELMTKSITDIFGSTQSLLKRISSGVEFGSQDSEHKVRSNIVQTLASKLQQSNIRLRRAQKEYLASCQQQQQIDGGFDFLSEAEQGKANGGLKSVDDMMGGSNLLTMEQLAVVEDTSRLAEERDEQIGKIVKSIEDLSQMFRELAVLVIDQGTILDRIDYNMEQVVDSVTDAHEQLRVAEVYQKSARPRWCILFLLIMIGIFIGVLVFKYTNDGRHQKASS